MRCPTCNKEVDEKHLELALIDELESVRQKLSSIVFELPTSDFSTRLYKLHNDLGDTIREKQIDLIEEDSNV